MGDQDTFLLAVASLLTCLVPAVRASAVDPIVTLREE
jgi:ABC-type lipoprotein release transport system permease subunit